MHPRLSTVLLLISTSFSLAATPLESWLEKQKGIRTLDCTFTQERKLPALKEPTITGGHLSFSKPSKFRWQLGEPAQTLVSSNGTTLTLIDFNEKTARQTTADSPQAARFSLLAGSAFESIDGFNQAFELIESRVTEGIYQYTLKPKERRFRSQVAWVFLDIDPSTNDLRAMEMELQDKSRLRTIFHDPKFNTQIPDKNFEPDLSGLTVK